MSVIPDPTVEGFPSMIMSTSKESREQLATVWDVHLKAVNRGVASALTNGPTLSFPVCYFN